MKRSSIPAHVLQVLTTLQANDYPSFLVGGCVRDLVLNKQPKDYDICTKALPEQVKSLFPKVIDTGIKYGTVRVLGGGFAVEVTTFRKGVHNPDGPRASVITYGTEASEDVLNRDFTINGLLFDGNQVLDYVDGQADLAQGIIRAIGDPGARFREDPLRLIRAVRLGCQLGFAIEPQTLDAITAHAPLSAQVSPERIREECHQILLSDRPDHGFRLLHQTGLLKEFLPELEVCYGFDQHNPHHTQDVFEHILTVVGNTPPEPNLRWAALLHDIGKPLTFTRDERGIGHFYGHQLKSYDLALKILTRLKMDKKMIRQVTLLIKEHMSKLKAPKRSTLRRLIHRVGVGNIHALLDLQIADVKRPGKEGDVENLQRVNEEIKAVLRDQEPVSPGELAINGDDLKALGIAPGKELGKILAALMDKVLERPTLNTREELLALAEKMLK